MGLGNPGSKYHLTRHNLGFMVVDNLCKKFHCQYKQKKYFYSFATIHIAQKSAILAKPLTYMNLSGMAIGKLIEKYEIQLKNVLIIVDDFNLPFGKIRIRSKGSDGGHNGLESIIQELSSDAFPRLRVGIGRENITDFVEFVLSEFDEEETKKLPNIIERSSEACLDFVVEGIEKTMTKYN